MKSWKVCSERRSEADTEHGPTWRFANKLKNFVGDFWRLIHRSSSLRDSDDDLELHWNLGEQVALTLPNLLLQQVLLGIPDFISCRENDL